MYLPVTYAGTYEEIRAFLGRYRQHLSAASMVAGFATDNVLFGRVDLPGTQGVLGGYTLLAAIAITLLHAAETRGEKDFLYRWRNLFPMAIQFALGSVWSGLLVFYSRSAVMAASWPFLLVLLAIFIGNEIFHHYVARLVFSTTLLFFALFSLAIMLVPVYVHAIGVWVFLLSGLVSVALFLAFLRGLLAAGAATFRAKRWQMLAGAAGVFALINVSYFTNILPPLPLALADSGVFHSIKRNGAVYDASGEAVPWYAGWFFTPTIHLAAGEPVYAFSSVFAPIKLTTRVRHRWEFYSPEKSAWVPQSTVGFTVNGGRRGGYRGYTIKHDPAPGDWRVNIETVDGRLIGRIRFFVARADAPPVLQQFALK